MGTNDSSLKITSDTSITGSSMNSRDYELESDNSLTEIPLLMHDNALDQAIIDDDTLMTN